MKCIKAMPLICTTQWDALMNIRVGAISQWYVRNKSCMNNFWKPLLFLRLMFSATCPVIETPPQGGHFQEKYPPGSSVKSKPTP